MAPPDPDRPLVPPPPKLGGGPLVPPPPMMGRAQPIPEPRPAPAPSTSPAEPRSPAPLEGSEPSPAAETSVAAPEPAPAPARTSPRLPPPRPGTVPRHARPEPTAIHSPALEPDPAEVQTAQEFLAPEPVVEDTTERLIASAALEIVLEGEARERAAQAEREASATDDDKGRPITRSGSFHVEPAAPTEHVRQRTPSSPRVLTREERRRGGRLAGIVASFALVGAAISVWWVSRPATPAAEGGRGPVVAAHQTPSTPAKTADTAPAAPSPATLLAAAPPAAPAPVEEAPPAPTAPAEPEAEAPAPVAVAPEPDAAAPATAEETSRSSRSGKSSKKSKEKTAAPTPAPAPKPETKPAPTPAPSAGKPATGNALADARAAFAKGRFAEAYSLAAKAKNQGGGDEAAELMARAACGMGSAAKATAALESVRLLRRRAIKQECKSRGVTL